MAKKDKLSTDTFNLDSDLDFGDFGIEQIDSQINPEVRKGSKKRKAVTEVFKGAISGARDEFKNPSFLAKVAKDSFPSSYGEVFKAASAISESTAQLYDEAVKDLKPQMSRIAKKIDRLVPDEQKSLKKLSSKAANFFGGGSQYQQAGAQQLQDQGVANALSQVFGAQQDMDLQRQARDNAEGRVKEQVEGKRFESNFGLLSSISDSAQRMSNYTEKVTQAYQKKSLELQYRSFFVQSELLQLSNKYYEVFKNQNEAIAKNTGLPDYVKITNTERILQEGKNRLAGKVSNFFTGPESAIGQGMKRIGAQAKDYLGGIKQGLEAALMGLDAAGDAADAAGDIGMSKATMAGNMLGGGAAKWGMGKVSGAIKKYADNSPKAKKLRDAGHRASNAAMNLPGAIDSLQNDQRYKDFINASGPKGKVGGAVDWLLSQFKEQKPDMSIKNSNSMSALGLGGKFDNRTQRSIVDVIPGFLSRILKEVTIIRTGDAKTESLMYDYTKGKFATPNSIYKSMTSAFDKKAKASEQGFRLDQMVGDVKGQSQTNARFDKKIKKFFLDISKIPNMDYTPTNILGTRIFATLKDKDPKVAEMIEKHLNDNVTNSSDKDANQANLTGKLGSIRNATPDIRAEIEGFIEAGYAEILESKGVIKTNSDGGYDIDEKMYHKLVDGSIVTSDKNKKTNIKEINKDAILGKLRDLKGRFVKSDVTTKEDIHPLNPKRALDAIKKTKVYNWMYKKGQGDNVPHNGPMAQDVKKNMGNDAAPGGTQLDLTTMNGNNMAAIQELHERQDKMEGKDGKGSKSNLHNISDNTDIIVKILTSKGQQSNTGSGAAGSNDGSYGSIMGSLFGPLGSLASKGAGDLFSAGKKVAGAVGTGIGIGAKGLNTAFDKVKSPAMGAIGWIIEKAGEVSMKALALGQDVLFNKLPAGFKQAKLLKDWAVGKAKDLFTIARDVYIKGKTEPVIKAMLLKAGHYRDQATGKVLCTMGDLKNLKGNVVNAAGEVILTIEDAATGLFDVDGKAIETGLEKLGKAALGFAMNGINRGKKFLSGALAAGKGLLGKGAGLVPGSFKDMFKNMGGFKMGSDRIYNVLVEIRDLMASKGGSSSGGTTETTSTTETTESSDENSSTSEEESSGSSAMGSMADTLVGKKGKGLLGKAKGFLGRGKAFLGKSKIGKGLGMLFGKKGASSSDAEEGSEKKTSLLNKIKSKATSVKNKITTKVGALGAQGKAAFNDRNGSGKRDGNANDRIKQQQDRAKANNKGFLQADLKEKYRGDNVIDMMMKKASGLLDFAKNGMTSILDIGGGLLGKAKDKIFGKAAGAAAGSVAGKVGGGLGSKILGKLGGKLIPGLGIAYGAYSTVDNLKQGNYGEAALDAGLTAGSVALMAGAGTAALSAIGAGLAGIGTFLASPVVLGALAVGAVGYGAYKLYKYTTRNSTDDYGVIRLAQYGLTPADKDNYSSMLALEAYLCDGKVGYDNGKAYLLDKTIDNKEMISLFSIDENDVARCNVFAKWFTGRFKPFFLTHMTALFSVNNKASLDAVGKLKYEEKIKYLGLIGFNGGPYDVLQSPIKSLPSLSETKELTQALINKLTSKVTEDNSKPKKKGTAAMANEVANGFKNSSVAPKRTDALPKTNVAPTSVNPNKATTAPNGGPVFQGEESSEAKNSGASIGSGSVGSIGKLKVAGGALRDGTGADQYMRLAPGVSLNTANPAMLKNLRAMIQEYGELTGKSVNINSGTRTKAEQEAMWRKDPKKAAKPGHSLHEFGLAVDMNSKDIDALEEAGLMRKYGFTRPVGAETWHIEPAGIQGNLNLAKNDYDFATQAVEASLFKGGGGVGSSTASPLGKRDTAVALALLNSGDSTVNATDKERTANILTPDKRQSQAVASTGSSTKSAVAANDSKIETGSIGKAVQVAGIFNAKNNLPATSNTTLPDAEMKPVVMTVSGSSPSPTDRGGIIKVIEDAARKQGVDPSQATAFAAVESSLNPNAKASSSSATGLFQFTNATWKEQMGKHARKHGLDPNTPATDPTANALMGTEYFKSNKKALSSVKSDVNLTDVYLAHSFGASGAKKFLSAHPSEIAAKVLPDAAKSNPSIFYAGGRALTIAEVYAKIDAKLANTAKQYGINLPASNGLVSKEAANSPTMSPSSSGSFSSPTVAASAPNSSAPVAAPKRVFSETQANVISSNDAKTVPQSSQNATANYEGMNDTLVKQLDIQTQMLTVLKQIADNSNATSASNGNGPSATPTRGRGVQSVSSAVDLSRKVA